MTIMLRILYKFELGNAKIAFENGKMLSKVEFSFLVIFCCFEENVYEFCNSKFALSNCIFALHKVLRDEAYRLQNNEKLVPICLILHLSCAFGHHAFLKWSLYATFPPLHLALALCLCAFPFPTAFALCLSIFLFTLGSCPLPLACARCLCTLP